MIVPLVRIYALRLGAEFETALTGKRGCVLEKVHRSEGVLVGFADGLTKILHNDVKVRPLVTVH